MGNIISRSIWIAKISEFVERLSIVKKVDRSQMVNKLLRKDMVLIDL